MNVPLYCPSRQRPENQNLYANIIRLEWVNACKTAPAESFLIIEDGKLGLAGANWPKEHPVFVDFMSGASEHRRLHGGGAGQAVAKAVGLNKRKDLKIWDGTAGLGRDAYVMATLGADVIMFERNPVVQLLLEDGLSRLSLSSELADINAHLLLQKMSISLYAEQNPEARVDVIYLDPMFPERHKSAKVKKDMALFHDVVGADEDAGSLLAPALERAEYRVVVKRSKQAPYLNDQKPTTSMVGKSSRFDIYSKKAIK